MFYYIYSVGLLQLLEIYISRQLKKDDLDFYHRQEIINIWGEEYKYYTYTYKNITLYHKYVIAICQLQVNFSKARKIKMSKYSVFF